MNAEINAFPWVIEQNERKKKGDFGVVSLSQQGVLIRKVALCSYMSCEFLCTGT